MKPRTDNPYLWLLTRTIRSHSRDLAIEAGLKRGPFEDHSSTLSQLGHNRLSSQWAAWGKGSGRPRG